MQAGDGRLERLGGLGGDVAAVHAVELAPLGTDGLVHRLALALEVVELAVEPLDLGAELVGVGALNLGGERVDHGTTGLGEELSLAVAQSVLEPGTLGRLALGLGKVVGRLALRLAAEPLELPAREVALGLGALEPPALGLA